MFSSKPKLTKEYIESHISNEEIFERYTGESVRFKKLYLSKLRTDRSPTCSYYTKGNKLRLKDNAGFFDGDCYEFVCKLYNCTFIEALEIIANDFNIVYSDNVRKPVSNINYEEKETVIKVKWRKFDSEDVEYWENHGISTRTLKKYKVGAITQVWINNELSYLYNPNDRAYGYWFNDKFKIYFPFRTIYRFLSNYSGLQGYDQLPASGDLLIITKSMKDVMLLDELGYNSVSTASENTMLTLEQFTDLSSRFKTIISLYDFDLAGVKGANKLKKTYGIKAAFFLNGRFGSVKSGKDITDIYFETRDKTKVICLLRTSISL